MAKMIPKYSSVMMHIYTLLPASLGEKISHGDDLG